MYSLFTRDQKSQLKQSLDEARNALYKAAYSSTKKRVLLAAINYLENRTLNDGVFKLVKTDIDARVDFLHRLVDLARHKDDPFIASAKIMVGSLESSSELKKELSAELATAEFNLAIRRQNVFIPLLLILTMLTVLTKLTTDSNILTMIVGMSVMVPVFKNEWVNDAIEICEILPAAIAAVGQPALRA